MNRDSYISFEKYQALKNSNELSKLALHKEHIQQSCTRYALVDDLVESFEWQYWVVITFGYNPQKHKVDEVLYNSHHRFDRWLLTNRKLQRMSINERSRWVCLPEKGKEGHLHYNCFLQLNIMPEVKTYNDEWNAVRNGLKTTFKSLEKAYKGISISFSLHNRRSKKNALKLAMYSTKEMRTEYIKEQSSIERQIGADHFANFIRSWKDWNVQPLNKRTPKKIIPKPKPSGILEQFMN